MIPKIIEFTKLAYMGPKEAYTYSAKKKEGSLHLQERDLEAAYLTTIQIYLHFLTVTFST